MPGGEPTTSNAQNPTVVYPEGEASNYPIQLTVVSPQGCRDSVTNFAKVVNDIVIYAPNSFTPNDDAYNDNWRIYIAGIDVYEFHLRIYNRWGEIVFESFDPEATWDGRLVSGRLVDPGTYVWLIEAKDISSSETIDFRGTVNVFK